MLCCFSHLGGDVGSGGVREAGDVRAPAVGRKSRLARARRGVFSPAAAYFTHIVVPQAFHKALCFKDVHARAVQELWGSPIFRLC